MIYVFDLDNTLCITQESEYINSQPIIDRINRVNKLYDDGHTIIIETARGCVSGKNWWYFTSNQLNSWGLKYHTLRTGVKWNGDFFIDDRAINDKDFFENTFNESGSGSNTKLILINRVRKEATNERMEKLIDEVNFINNLPSEFKKNFPEISLYGRDKNSFFYEMTHYNLPSLRRLIFSKKLKIDETLSWIDKVTNFSVNLYNYERIEKPKNFFNYLHWDRFWTRKKELEEKSEVFKKIFSEDTIEINGKIYNNSHIVVEKLMSLESFFEPDVIGRLSHSDLHFSNILVDLKNDSFICIDPRGYEYCDLNYDFGKLWHSVNGKYEMVANEMYTIDGNNYELTKNEYFKFLEELKMKIPEKIFFKYSDNNPVDIMRKIEFNEAMHFITLVPFQLCNDGIENKARVAYFIGVELLNNLLIKYNL